VTLILYTANGFIYAGGGGGGGGGGATLGGSYNGAAGGDRNTAGDDALPLTIGVFDVARGGHGGAAGYAIRHTASGSVTFETGGSPPDVVGSVGI